jgi:hypothetical protein
MHLSSTTHYSCAFAQSSEFMAAKSSTENAAACDAHENDDI